MKNFIFLNLVFLSIIPLYSMEKPQEIDWYKTGAKIYGTIQLGTLIHELGHMAVGKKLYNCKGFIFITPWFTGASYLHFGGPILKKIIYDLLKKNHDHLKVFVPIQEGIRGAAVSFAGPASHLTFALLLPITNTFYNEYKKNKSFSLALQKTIKQPFFNDEQDIAIQIGSICSANLAYVNLIPFKDGIDGHRILEYLKLNQNKIRWPIVIAMGALYTFNIKYNNPFEYINFKKI